VCGWHSRWDLNAGMASEGVTVVRVSAVAEPGVSFMTTTSWFATAPGVRCDNCTAEGD
jgi:hypothetical protein